MEALSVDTIPTGDTWQYEPKWDGFRCLATRTGKSVAPSTVAALRALVSELKVGT